MSSDELQPAESPVNAVKFPGDTFSRKMQNSPLNGTYNASVEPFYFLNVYKPKGITSFDVIFKLRKRLKIKKIGHSGTLDPLADGVMQVAVGRATRLLDYLPSNKTYLAKIKFGYISTTGDLEGEISAVNPPEFTEGDLEIALKSMTGEIEQVPPVYSAIKVQGKKLCDLARKNKADEIEIPKRIVTIYEAKLLHPAPEPYSTPPAPESSSTSPEPDLPCRPFVTNLNEIEVEISCSKGTYIRSFALDLARKLNTGAYLTSLTRTKAGNFTLENSVKIDEINPEIHAISPNEAVSLPKYMLDKKEYELVLNGVSFAPKNIKPNEDDTFALVFENNLVSIGILSDNKIVPKKVFK